MSTVIASNVLANGLRTEFADTYSAIRNRQADSRLGLVMDLSVTATNRDHDFGYFEAAPHMEYWRRGDSHGEQDVQCPHLRMGTANPVVQI